MQMGKTRQSLCDHKPLEVVPESEWLLFKSTHKPIVDLALWEAANKVTMERRQKFYETQAATAACSENIFKGFLACGFCGSKLARKHEVKSLLNGGKYEAYRFMCQHTRKHPESSVTASVTLEKLLDIVFPVVKRKLELAANLGRIIEKRSKRQVNPRAALDTEITRATRELETINQRIAGLYESYVDKLLSEMEYVGMKATYENRAESLRNRIVNLSRHASAVADVSASENRWLWAVRDFQNPAELTREMLEALVGRIVVSGLGDVKIVWKFADEFKQLQEYAERGGHQHGGDAIHETFVG